MFARCSVITLLASLASLTSAAQDNYDITFQSAAVEFSDTEDNEIVMTYNISDKNFSVALFGENCTVDVGADLISHTDTADTPADDYKTLTTSLNINASAIEDSILWSQSEDSETGYIKVCARVDLLDEIAGANYSITYDETLLEIEIDMSQDFTVNGVNIQEDTVITENRNATLEYTVFCCACKGGLPDGGSLFVNDDTCNNTAEWTQSEELILCCKVSDAEDVVFERIDTLVFNQAGLPPFTAITGGQDNAISTQTIDPNNEQQCEIRTRILAQFYDSETESTVNITGVSILEFASTSRRQLAKVNMIGMDQDNNNNNNKNNGRNLQDGPANAEFDTVANLAPLQQVEEDEDEDEQGAAEVSGAAMHHWFIFSPILTGVGALLLGNLGLF